MLLYSTAWSLDSTQKAEQGVTLNNARRGCCESGKESPAASCREERRSGAVGGTKRRNPTTGWLQSDARFVSGMIRR
jgi:hypothetical protein